MKVKWETWGGKKYQGEVVEVDGDTVFVRLVDGSKKAADINGLEVII